MDTTAEPKRSVEEWLSIVNDSLQDLKGLDLSLDQTRRVLVKFPANNTDYVVVTFDQPAEYIYVPSMPRSVTVYFGTGPGQQLATVGAGEPFLMRFPRVDALTFLPDAGTGNADQFDLWFSTRPIDLGGIATIAQFASVLASDNMTNPTAPQVLADMMVFDGTTWDRLKGGTSASSGHAGIAPAYGTFTDNDQTGIGRIVSVTGAGLTLAVCPGLFNGTGLDRARTPFVFKPFAATAIVAGTGLTVWTPAAGKKFRLMGWSLSTNTAADLIFGDNLAATVIYRTGVQQVNTVVNSPDIGNGILSAAANNVLKLDVSVGATVGGTVWGTEE